MLHISNIIVRPLQWSLDLDLDQVEIYLFVVYVEDINITSLAIPWYLLLAVLFFNILRNLLISFV